MKHLTSIVLAGVVLVSCADPRVAGPNIEALEARNPVMSDLELETAERIGFERYDGGDNGDIFASDSHTYSTTHDQAFGPNDGYDLDEVMSEVLDAAEVAGWEMFSNRSGTSSCGQHDLNLLDRPFDTLSVVQIDMTIQGDRIVQLSVELGGAPACDFDSVFTEPWKG